jgi:hydrogenase nickel incorporation protein HypA/HybF
MHEASLVASLLRLVDELVLQNGGGSVAQVRVEIGPLAGVEPILFREAFERLRTGTSAVEAELLVDAVGLTCRCRDCQLEYITDALRFDCPTCSGKNVDVTAGDAVVLHSVTLSQPDEATPCP